MPSTTPLSGPNIAGVTILPGLQVGPYGASFASIKVYGFSLSTAMTNLGTGTSTFVGSTGIQEFVYNVSGLTTNDIALALNGASTGYWGQASGVGTSTNHSFIAGLRITSTAGLAVAWGRTGTGTGAVLDVPTPATLLTYSYITQATSTTT